MSAKDRIVLAFEKALDRMAQRGKAELKAQGHVASGRGLESIEGIRQNRGLNVLIGVIMAEDYLVPISTGVPAEKIPYSRSGNGGTSEYITKLLEWADLVKPSLSESERRSFVFAVANKAKQTGHPTPGSLSFSSNGRRTGWIDKSFDTDEARAEFEDAFDIAAILAEEFLASLP